MQQLDVAPGSVAPDAARMRDESVLCPSFIHPSIHRAHILHWPLQMPCQPGESLLRKVMSGVCAVRVCPSLAAADETPGYPPIPSHPIHPILPNTSRCQTQTLPGASVVLSVTFLIFFS
ncbi:uncharacterized protein LY79DRAFT_14844 [Colletotrichum navitas]|uniref:Uncharacterized protein n=1 Tax=Colletotrichum navitas TaxID=681940 RepID=A0AAD8VCP5_9PEZI|nr:uncharacterized protein LY79DRAFT_14844 [Colletotrichum navitas]KAK1600333.1 hypothetical protein LY79DRAFT_14844 [Colletotrichum navitas]